MLSGANMDLNNSPTAPKMATSAQRRVQALELRKAGYTYEQIGVDLGISTSMAYKHVVKALRIIHDKTSEATEELRTLEVQRIDRLFEVMYKKAEKGDHNAIDRCLRLMERRAKLLGLDAPMNANINMMASIVINWDEDATQHDND